MNCKTCGRQLERKQHSFCSRDCSNKRNIKSIQRICKACGNRFVVYPSQPWRSDYCSLECSPRHIANKEKVCEYCGKGFVAFSHRAVIEGKYCSRQCLYDSNNSNTVVHCCICEKPIPSSPRRSNRSSRHFCSPECKSIGQSGEGNPAWNGGAGSYRGPNWWKQRQLARKRDAFTCQQCGITEEEIGQSLDVHHIKPFRLFDDYKAANALDNLVSLCHLCHLTVERPLNRL